jgi:RNA polymerase sigma-70 factor (ECF subfamily)
MIDLDVELLDICAGDQDAFARWVAGAESTLRASLSSFARDVDTEAVLQEALLRVWQLAPRVVGDGRGNALFRFGLRVARNLAIDELRRARGVAFDERVLEADTREPQAPDPLLRRVIEECTKALPSQPAAALGARLDDAGGNADETLAARLGMRLNTFLKNIGRARKLLAHCLEKRGVKWELR